MFFLLLSLLLSCDDAMQWKQLRTDEERDLYISTITNLS